MLYLVMPDGGLKWTSNIGQSVVDFADENGRDLGLFDWWTDADERSDVDTVRVALRYGIASSVGIVVDAGPVVTVRRPRDMRKTFRESEAVFAASAPQMKAIDQFIEDNLAEGWIKNSEDIDRRVKDSLTRSLDEADRDAFEVLLIESKPVLESHWVALGGVMPE